MSAVCKCVTRHSPVPHELNDHHILPKSWGGRTEPSNLVTVCPNAHASIHVLLNAYVRARGVPPKLVLAGFNPHTRILAKQAWDQRPNDRPPYTSQHGAI